jgi:predicted phosphate transport protein (TIGR00153 family)
MESRMFLDRLVRFLIPRQTQFFSLLEELADKIDASAAVFAELETATGRDRIAAVATKLKPIETEADGVCQRLYQEIDRTFVTPIDREDLARLTKVLDNVVDGMEHTAAFAALFRFADLTEPMRNLVRITVACTREIAGAARHLRKFADPESVKAPTFAVHALENEADAVYRKAIAALFDNGVNPVELVRQKDMLFSLEEGVDQCEDAMDAIRSVVVKNG